MSASGHWRTVTPGEVGGARVGIRRDGGYFPLGPGGHSNATRLNFIAARGDIVARAAAAGVSISTARRWENSIRDRGAIERRPHGGGATRLLSNEEAEQLAWYNVWDPSAYQDESAAYVATVRGTHPSQPTVSRELRQMGFRRLRANTRTLGGPTAESLVQYRSEPPPRGVFGVQTRLIIDVAEAACYASASNRNYGYFLQHTHPHLDQRSTRSGVKRTVFNAANVVFGCIPYVVSLKGTTTELFSFYIVAILLPALTSVFPNERFVFTWDNLSSHFGTDMLAILDDAGHAVVARPPHRPEEAFIEAPFNDMNAHLRRQHHITTEENLTETIMQFFESYPAERVAAHAAHAHYPVDGHAYSPSTL